MAEKYLPEPGDALVVVDVQRDFCAGGALAVRDGDRVVAPLNAAIERFGRASLPVLFTRDWHPRDHSSFATQGGPWPVHCVAGSPGAAFHPGLTVPAGATVIDKGTERERPGYSGFEGTALEARLQAGNVRRLLVGGLATDYCVRATALDARRSGFEVYLLTDAVRAVDINAGDSERAVEEMRAAGVKSLLSTEV